MGSQQWRGEWSIASMDDGHLYAFSKLSVSQQHQSSAMSWATKLSDVSCAQLYRLCVIFTHVLYMCLLAVNGIDTCTYFTAYLFLVLCSF